MGETREEEFKPVKFRKPEVALAMSVTMTMNHPAFARLKFGEWARVLVGQINRGDYLFLLNHEKPVAFAGWVPTTEKAARDWLEREVDFPAVPHDKAECAVVNVVVADSAAATRALRRAAARAAPHIHTIYGKRILKDGRRRLVRMGFHDGGRG